MPPHKLKLKLGPLVGLATLLGLLASCQAQELIKATGASNERNNATSTSTTTTTTIADAAPASASVTTTAAPLSTSAPATTMVATTLVTNQTEFPRVTTSKQLPLNLLEQVNNNSNKQETALPNVRQSQQDLASELSRRHLNMANENWRLKSSTKSTLLQTASDGTRHGRVGGSSEPPTGANLGAEPTQVDGNDGEREIFISPASSPSFLGSSPTSTSLATPDSFEVSRLDDLDDQDAPASAHTAASSFSSTASSPSTPSSHRSPLSASSSSSVLPSTRAPFSSSSSSSQAKQQTASRQSGQKASSSRRRKKQQQWPEEVELHQCQQYLHMNLPASLTAPPQSSLSSSQPTTLTGAELNRIAALGQQFPCSCEFRRHFSGELAREPTVWLTCDNVQLIASGGRGFWQMSNTNIGDDITGVNSTAGNKAGLGSAESSSSETTTTTIGGQLKELKRFSQRDSGLQKISSQKFHEMSLFHLTSIDLSNNKIRQLKFDAFHGLETKLEYLNLAQNLLGDSRAIFSGQQSANGAYSSAQDFAQSSVQYSLPSRNKNENLIFLTDELSRLKKLKWLSLRGNKISQLGSNIFFKPTILYPNQAKHSKSQEALEQQVATFNDLPLAPTAQVESASQRYGDEQAISELIHLDLSENLLTLVPSDSLDELGKLEFLKLNGNRITRLDKFSKFPQTLRYLDLSDNLISSVRQCDLIDLPDLVELDMSRNQLTRLDKSSFVSSLAAKLGGSLAHNLILSSAAVPSPEQTAAAAPAAGSPADLINDLQPSEAGGQFGPADSLSSVQFNENDEQNSESLSGSKRIQKREIQEPPLVASNVMSASDRLSVAPAADYDLEADESSDIMSSIVAKEMDEASFYVSKQQQQQQVPTQSSQFNATKSLNLSYNYFEQIPGDALLKFTNLHHLDMSYNRIRQLDSNYLCSIYNLVEKLRTLDLSGNLLSIADSQYQQQPSLQVHNESDSSQGSLKTDTRQLIGCLQRLEKLSLAVSRLTGSLAQVPSRESPSKYNSNDQDQDYDLPPVAPGLHKQQAPNVLDAVAPGRLVIRFGENSGNKNLVALDLSDNQLKQVPIFERDPSSLAGGQPNQTSSLLTHWFNSRMNLELLSLGYNQIESLDNQDFEHVNGLRKLHLDFNKLTSLPKEVMRKFTNLETLSLAGNRISKFEPINELFENSIRSLRHLNLASNRIVEWPQLSDRLLAQLQHQQDRRHQNSANYERPAHLVEFVLEDLNLSSNLLTNQNVSALFEQLTYMRSLKFLNLSNNLLQRVKSEWFKFANDNLEQLSLTGNRINNIDLGSFASNQLNKLTHLNLDYNILKELKRKTFDSMPKIRVLNIANNLIHTINSETFHQINTLQVLILKNNKITSWKCEYFSNFCNSINGNINVNLSALISSNLRLHDNQESQHHSSLSNLVDLDLSYNSISQLRANSIAVHTKLVRLNLEHNKLSFIPHDLFKVSISDSSNGRTIRLISSLKYVNLANNRIQMIDNINFRPLKNLVTLDLSFNELQALGNDVIASLESRKSVGHHESNQRELDFTQQFAILGSPQNISGVNQHLLMIEDILSTANKTHASTFDLANADWPALGKLRHLNLAHNQLTQVNQSILNELSPSALLNLNLSSNYLDHDSLPFGFFTKVTLVKQQTNQQKVDTSKLSQSNNYELIFTLKLESLDLSRNRLSEMPSQLLETHHSSMESCNLAFNRIQHISANSNLMIHIKALNLEQNPLSLDSNELILFSQRNVRHLNLASTRLYAIQLLTNPPTSNQDQKDQRTTGATNSFSQINSNSYLKNRRLVNQTSQLDLIRSINKPIEAPYLKSLNLSSNQLVWLSANAFDRMHSLQVLDLSNNQLTRLHLLNSQLLHVSQSLEYLNMAHNLFTSIDSSDFNQLTKLTHLDIGNLLSLNKLNCKFLSRLSSLKSLKMYNYPRLRSSLSGMYTNLEAPLPASSNSSSQAHFLQRLQSKLRSELIYSTIGQHCYQNDEQLLYNELARSAASRWFSLESLELELFNNYGDTATRDRTLQDSGFTLRDELKELLGPHMRQLTLVGSNLTALSETSLLGIIGEELKLKISYTSISELPIRQILTSLSKKTRLSLDFRNNLIHSVDVKSLQMLDELPEASNQMSQVLQSEQATLKLSSNPIRCNCQTRPLWLWLNQHWATQNDPTVASASAQEEPSNPADLPTLPATGTSSNVNHWLRFNSMAQTSDLKCYYPAKLRGRLTQHVNYNDLVCRSGTRPVPSPEVSANQPSRQSKKRNETLTSSDTAPASLSLPDSESDSGIVTSDDEDYADFELSGHKSDEPSVRVTKFNRYPAIYSGDQSSFIDSSQLLAMDSLSEARDRMGKRDHNSVAESPTLSYPPAIQIQTINYDKQRPIVQQKHSSFNTFSAFKPIPLTKTFRSGRHTWLTESDILILTVTGAAMTIMSLIIMGICLLKYKLDTTNHKHQVQMLNSHRNKIISMPQALFLNEEARLKANSKYYRPQSEISKPKGGLHSGSNSSHTSANSKKSNNKGSSSDSGGSKQAEASSGISKSSSRSTGGRRYRQLRPMPLVSRRHALVPLNSRKQSHQVLANGTQNFLMRSPTIRRMHGLANNAGDWFKFTLRAYPPTSSVAGNLTRRRLFLSPKLPNQGSQLTTAQLVDNDTAGATAVACPKSPSSLSQERTTILANGCPLHGMNVLRALKEAAKLASQTNCVAHFKDAECSHCFKLLNAAQQTRVQRLNPIKIVDGPPTVAGISDKKGIASEQQEIKLNILDSDNNNHHHHYRHKLTPSLIKDLANELDSRHHELDRVSNWQQQNNFICQDSSGEHGASSYIGMTNQTQPMRTSRTFQSNSSFGKDQLDARNVTCESQLPTIDVEGKFCYQSESQLDSPVYQFRPTESVLSCMTTNTTRSGNEDVFILMSHSPADSRTIGCPETIEVVKSRLSSAPVGEVEDQCSRTSSPMAYRFQQSSPSLLTQTSTTMTSTNINQAQHQEASRQPVASVHSNNHDRGGSQKSGSPISVHDQVVVSRL